MTMTSHAVFLVCGCVLLTITLILHIICLATPYHSEAENIGEYLGNKSDLRTYRAFYPDMDASYGFWKWCMNVYGSNVCYNFGRAEDVDSKTIQAPDWLIACQALSIAGLIVGALGVLFPLVWFCITSTWLIVIGSGSAIFGGIIIIVANVVFAAEKSMKFVFTSSQMKYLFGSPGEKYINAVDNAFIYGWGFGLDIATGILCVLVGVLFALCAALVKSGNLYLAKGGQKSANKRTEGVSFTSRKHSPSLNYPPYKTAEGLSM